MRTSLPLSLLALCAADISLARPIQLILTTLNTPKSQNLSPVYYRPPPIVRKIAIFGNVDDDDYDEDEDEDEDLPPVFDNSDLIPSPTDLVEDMLEQPRPLPTVYLMSLETPTSSPSDDEEPAPSPVRLDDQPDTSHSKELLPASPRPTETFLPAFIVHLLDGKDWKGGNRGGTPRRRFEWGTALDYDGPDPVVVAALAAFVFLVVVAEARYRAARRIKLLGEERQLRAGSGEEEVGEVKETSPGC